MPYAGEVSRLSKTTASGAPYVEVKVNPFSSGDTLLVCIPGSVDDGDSVTLMLCGHGHNGSEETINSAMMAETRDMALEKGWLVVSSLAHGNAWASNLALADYARADEWVRSAWTVRHLLLHGQSMGALTLALFYSRGLASRARAFAGIDGAYNLAVAFESSSYRSAIRTSYGIASDGSDFAIRTAGHDVTELDPATYAGKRLFLSASPADGAIPKVSHTDKLVTMLGDEPDVLELAVGTGAHVTIENYFPDEVHAFFEAAIAAAPPEPVGPTPLPEGIATVTMWMSTPEGAYFRVEPADGVI